MFVDKGTAEFQDVHGWDYPDFTDACIIYAERDGIALSEAELDELDDCYVHELLQEYLY